MFGNVDKVWKNVRATLFLSLVAALLAQALVPGMAEEEPAVPEWINEINPADYILLDSDLPSDLKVVGDINVEAKASETAVIRKGKSDVERVAVVEIHEDICHPDPEGIYDCIGGNYLVDVYVYETADLARAVWENTIVEQYGKLPALKGFDYVSNVMDPQDSRFGGEGRCVGPYILYKNLVCTIFGNWDENDRKIGSLWLDKVSKTQPPKVSDLKIDEYSLWMGYPNQIVRDMESYRPMREIAADQQSVQALVFNVGEDPAEDLAEDVHVQFYVQRPGDPDYQPVGDPVLVGEIPAQGSKAATTYWDLAGENVEGAVVLAQAYIPGKPDLNPDDNSAGIEVNIYYAQNGNQAFSFVDDAYSFKNYGFEERETEELVEGVIATVAGNMEADPAQKDLWIRLFFPQTYARFWRYINASASAGAGGHCYGMASTSAIYFDDSSLKPVSKKTGQMTLPEASQNIAIYHRAQMLPLTRSLLEGDQYFGRDWGQARTYQAIKNSLKEDRKPLIVSFRGVVNNETRGHAVLAYKLVEVTGRDGKEIYVYDSNFPARDVEMSNRMMPTINLYPDGTLWWWARSYMGYGWRDPGLIAAHPVLRTIPLEEANALLPDLKKTVTDWIETLNEKNRFAAVLRCPADAVFTDSQGRRVGTVDGNVINEIPKAEVMSAGEVEMYLLPQDSGYSVEISGTDSGEMDFDVIRPEGAGSSTYTSSVNVVSFQKVALGRGMSLTSELESGGRIESLISEGAALSPSLSGTLDLGDSSETPPLQKEKEDETAAEGNTGTEKVEDDVSGSVSESSEVGTSLVQELIFERNTLGAVDNSPPNPTKFSLDRERTITKIETYHWNHGQGKAPGMIGLQDENSKVIGMWPAEGEPGSRGVADAYWEVRPHVTLPAGEYSILDSDPATWSHNLETGGEGIVWVYAEVTLEDGATGMSSLQISTASENVDQVNQADQEVTISAQQWVEKGNDAYYDGLYEAALGHYTEALKLDPLIKDAWIGRGDVLFMLERYKESLESFEKALEIDPRDSYAWEGKGLALIMLERYDEAEDAYTEAERRGHASDQIGYGDLILDAPPGGWEGVIPGEAI